MAGDGSLPRGAWASSLSTARSTRATRARLGRGSTGAVVHVGVSLDVSVSTVVRRRAIQIAALAAAGSTRRSAQDSVRSQAAGERGAARYLTSTQRAEPRFEQRERAIAITAQRAAHRRSGTLAGEVQV
jgi:hypothetical protein